MLRVDSTTAVMLLISSGANEGKFKLELELGLGIWGKRNLGRSGGGVTGTGKCGEEMSVECCRFLSKLEVEFGRI